MLCERGKGRQLLFNSLLESFSYKTEVCVFVRITSMGTPMKYFSVQMVHSWKELLK